MRISLIIALLSMLLTSAKAQHITAKEIIESADCRDFKCYSDFIKMKDFHFVKVSEKGKDITYTFDSNYFTDVTGHKAIKETITSYILFSNIDSSTSIGVQTLNMEYYEQLVAQFLKQGFAYSGAEPYKDGSLQLKYNNSTDSDLVLNIYMENQTSDGDKYNVYHFVLTKYSW